MKRVGLLLVGLVVFAVGGLVLAYGEIDPCRALAVERTRRAGAALGGLQDDAVLLGWARLTTSQMSAGQCADGLLDSWGERLSGRNSLAPS